MATALAAGTAKGIVEGLPKVFWKIVLTLLSGTVGYIIVRKIVLNSKFQKAQKDFGQDTPDGKAVGFASLLYNAMHPSGIPWLPDGTDLETMYSVADKMNETGIPFTAVSNMYKNLFQRKLLEDIVGELNASELEKFNQTLQSGLQGFGYHVTDVNVVASQATSAISSDGNQIKVSPNRILGEKTRQLSDPKSGKTYLGFFMNGKEYFIDAEQAITIEKVGI